jgi:hypothetical protein
MLQVKLNKVVMYATQHESMMRKAVEEFFGITPIDQHMENIEAISGLFNEWLIFDFKMPSGATFIVDYYFRNPDSLPKEQLEELRQIIETQQFEMLELQSIKRGKCLRVYGLYSGKNYTVYEHSGSLAAPEKGTFWGRIARVHDKHILVGSNPMFFSTISTPRSKKLYLANKPDHFSPKDVLPLVLSQRAKSSLNVKKQMSKKELEKKRASLKEQFEKLQKDNSLSVSFESILSFVYNENYKNNFADFFADLIKLGIPEKIVFFKSDLFNDIWNFFPHKLLNGKSPYESEIGKNSKGILS